MNRATWKQVERRIAELLDGERVPVTGRSRGSAPDIAHPTLSLEVKHRKALPKWLHNAMEQAEASHDGSKTPTVILHEKQMKFEDSYVIVRLKDFLGLSNGET